jgi:hypothetical protein
MGKFAETANVDYCFSLANQGKHTSVLIPNSVYHTGANFKSNSNEALLMNLFKKVTPMKRLSPKKEL